jgi:plastocyanin
MCWAAVFALSASATTNNVTIIDYQFIPSQLTITQNDMVQWTWASTNLAPHSTTANGIWDSQPQNAGATFTLTFTGSVPANYPYHCTVHPTIMMGNIQVLPAGLSVSNNVTIIDYQFIPSQLTITQNDTVRWTWASTNQAPHSTTSNSGIWDSQPQNAGATFTLTFTDSVPANYPYHCTVHPTIMMGNIQVQPHSASAPITNKVTIIDYQFIPSQLTVKQNDTVRWTWASTNLAPHSTTSDGALWDSQPQNGGATFALTFTGNVLANYPYHCTVHPAIMTGNIQVQPAGSSAPVIVTQPQGALLHAHDSITLSATATGTPPLIYQWSLNGTNVPGATSSALTISNLTQSNLGAYAVVVTNAFGATTSSPNAILYMLPFVAKPFGGAVGYWGKDAVLSVQAWGTGPLSLQWFKDGIAISGETNQDLILTSLQFTDAALYSVVVSNQFGSVTNPPAQLVVNPAGVSLGLCPAVTISGVVGYSYIIQSTPDLRNTNAWVTLTNLTLTQPVQLWVDTNTDASLPTHPYRFYRVLPGQ